MFHGNEDSGMATGPARGAVVVSAALPGAVGWVARRVDESLDKSSTWTGRAGRGSTRTV